MHSKWTNFFLTGIILVLIQLLTTNSISFYGLFNPKIYPIFLLLLPRDLKPAVFMLIGFFYGGLIDILSNTHGFGIASCVFITFIRPYALALIYNKSPQEESEISVKIQGANLVFVYLFIGLILFHIFYFFTELGEIANIFYVLLKSILSSILALIFYSIYYMLFHSVPKKNR
jgi:rod shape-determining protein MreD